MSKLQKLLSDSSGFDPGPETRARAALVEMETREPEATKNIRAIGKEPGAIPESVATLVAADLYAPGNRPERRQILLRHAIQYLFEVPLNDERGQDRVIARMGARIKLMVDWMVGSWEQHLRPKTWMDSLSPEQQEEWAVAKRKYDRDIETENKKLSDAREVYDKAVRSVQLKQATSREELRDVLRGFGLNDAPLLTVPDEKEGLDLLGKEIRSLGMNFRPPDERIE